MLRSLGITDTDILDVMMMDEDADDDATDSTGNKFTHL
jgi:hypothetical protein